MADAAPVGDSMARCAWTRDSCVPKKNVAVSEAADDDGVVEPVDGVSTGLSFIYRQPCWTDLVVSNSDMAYIVLGTSGKINRSVRHPWAGSGAPRWATGRLVEDREKLRAIHPSEQRLPRTEIAESRC